MLFATEKLAARIECADAQMLRDAVAGVRRRLGGAVFAREIAGGVAAFTELGSPLNKVFGIGFHGRIDPDELRQVEEAYAAVNCPVRIEVPTLADPEVVKMLTQRGYALVGFENVLGQQLPVAGLTPPSSDLEIVPAPAGEFEAWLDLMVDGFGVPDAQGVPSTEAFDREVLHRIIGDFVRASGIVCYVVRRGGESVGGAAMRQFEGIAQMCGAATLPAHRRRGVQSSLLSFRLAEASHGGCEIAVVTTQPGSKSQQNVQQHGFELLYTRAILMRDAQPPLGEFP